MTSFRRLSILAATALAVTGLASATTVGYNATAIVYNSAAGNQTPPINADFTYQITLPDFNSSLGTLTGVQIYFFTSLTATAATLTNTGSTNQNNFSLVGTTDIVTGMTNSATSTDIFHDPLATPPNSPSDPIQTFTSGNIANLGGVTTPGVCASTTGASTCNQINFGAQAAVTDINTGILSVIYTNGTGLQGVSGLILNGTSIGNYIGGGSFNLAGSTVGSSTITGASSVIGGVSVVGRVNAEVDYTYTVASSTPEPTTMVLFGSALVGLGLLRKRVRQ